MLEDSVNFGIVSKFPGQMIPLTSAAEAMDDRVENRSPVITGTAGRSRWIIFIEQNFDDFPEII
jgi:hypothetical protein